MRENKQTEKSPLQLLLSKRNKRILCVSSGKVVQWRGLAAVGAVTEGKFRTIIFKCKVLDLNSQRANTEVFE